MDPARIRLLLAAARVGRLATITADGRPHVIPFCFALVDDQLVSVVDFKPKRTADLARLRNIRINPRVEVLVDHYEDDWRQLWWLRGHGTAQILESGPAWEAAIDRLAAKYPQYQERRPRGAVISILPESWTAWSSDEI